MGLTFSILCYMLLNKFLFKSGSHNYINCITNISEKGESEKDEKMSESRASDKHSDLLSVVGISRLV